MPKRYSQGHFARRLRRQLAAHGHDCDVEWMAKPSYRSIHSDTLIRVTTRSERGIEVMHHSVASPPGVDCLTRILANQLRNPDAMGATSGMIYAAHQAIGSSVVLEPDMPPIVYRASGDDHLSVDLVMRPLDVIGRPHQMTIAYPLTQGHHRTKTFVVDLKRADARRRTRGGRPVGLRVGAGLATILRAHPDGLAMAREIMPGLARSVDLAEGAGSEQSEVTVVEARARIRGVYITVSARDIAVVGHELAKDITINGDIITIPDHLPEQVMILIAGRTLGEVIEGLPIASTTVIRRAYGKKSGTALVIDGSAITLASLMRELETRDAEATDADTTIDRKKD